LKKKICNDFSEVREIVSRLIHLRRHAVTSDSIKAVKILQEYLDLKLIKLDSGTQCWDWDIPPKWSFKEATIKFNGKIIFSGNEHIMAIQPYCSSFEGEVDLEELKKHLTYNKLKPDAYSYNCRLAYRYPFEKNWLVSIPYKRVKALKKGSYTVSIKSSFTKGTMVIGEKTLKGKTDKTIVLLSDICHPGQADDGIVGVALWVKVMKELSSRKNLNYSYKFFTPTETIGSIAWLWYNKKFIKNIKFGMFLESIGNKMPLKCKMSHIDNHEIDRMAKIVFKKKEQYKFTEGVMNDELVFADSSFNIPMISLQRFPYPEYHTSEDNLDIILDTSLEETYGKLMKLIDIIEANYTPIKIVKGPVFLSKHKLYIEVNNKEDYWKNWNIMNLLGVGKSILEISEEIKFDFWKTHHIIEQFRKAGVVKAVFE